MHILYYNNERRSDETGLLAARPLLASHPQHPTRLRNPPLCQVQGEVVEGVETVVCSTLLVTQVSGHTINTQHLDGSSTGLKYSTRHHPTPISVNY